ncbi:hypothetical protein [Falsiroseomonas sp. E2-1-a20]|uniref:hypothetical protein n=1 Tax=Falsiroseomonas sp. E2-1-a20 TaxID=3239300 RepID=UPI003F3AFFAB
MIIHSGAHPTLAPRAVSTTDDLPRLAAHGLLDLGWVALRRDEGPHPALPSVEAGLILAHPGFGIALLDVAPARSADSATRLRQRLTAADFGKAFPGWLPIIHRNLEAEDLWRLPLVLDHAFAAEPPLDLHGRGWMEAVQQALQTVRGEAAAVALPGPAEPDILPEEAAERPPAPLLTASEAAAHGPVAAAAPRRARSLRGLAQASGAVLLVLGAGAGLLQYMGQGDAPPAAPTVGAPTVGAPVETQAVETQAVETQAAQPAARLRIVLHHPPGRRLEAMTLAEPIRDSESRVEFRDFDAAAPAPRAQVVRYFHDSDLAEAQDVQRGLGPGWRLQDFTHLAEGAARGAVEIWLPADEPTASRPDTLETGASDPGAMAAAAGGAAGSDAVPVDAQLADSAARSGSRPGEQPTSQRAVPPAEPPPAAVAQPPEPDLAAPPLARAPALAAALTPTQMAGQPPALPDDQPVSRAAPAAPEAVPGAGSDGPVTESRDPVPASPPGEVAPSTSAADAPVLGTSRQPDAEVAAPADPPGPPSIATPSAQPPAAETGTPLVEDPSSPVAAPAEPPRAAEPAPAPRAAEPAASPPAPAPQAAPPAATLSPALVAALLARGNQMFQQGDISGARLLFARAASAGSAAAATAMARSFDEAVLTSLGARGIRPDAAQAAAWYRRAAELESAR